jgi:hypothetical protein
MTLGTFVETTRLGRTICIETHQACARQVVTREIDRHPLGHLSSRWIDILARCRYAAVSRRGAR